MNSRFAAIFMAILAALLFGISSPVSKILLNEIPPTLMAALLYLGAGIGMLLLNTVRRIGAKDKAEAGITKKELPYVLGMVVLDIAAPIFLMLGLSTTTAANASLLGNFEIVATSVIALAVFKEAIGRRLWIAIFLITLASGILSFEDLSSFSFSIGSVFVILACLCWGFENNCTRMLSLKDPLQIVVIKGFGSGLGSLVIALSLGQKSSNILYMLVAMILGFVAYGLSIYFYIFAQRGLGAARTSAYYAFAPFIGVLLSIIIFGQQLSLAFLLATAIMIVGAYLAGFEHHKHVHIHHQITHEHRHNHTDGHHTHAHDTVIEGEHCHLHTHEELSHSHTHTPDAHHSHTH